MTKLSTLSIDAQLIHIVATTSAIFGSDNKTAHRAMADFVANRGDRFMMEYRPTERGASIMLTVRTERSAPGVFVGGLNWSSNGSNSLVDATAFATALVQATQTAKQLETVLAELATASFGDELEEAYRAWFMARFAPAKQA